MPNEAIYAALQAAFSPEHLEIIDNSWMHAGHAAMANVNQAEGTHLQIILVSDKFAGVPLIDRHRLVHEALKDAFAQHLHALELKAWTPQEWGAKNTAETKTL